MNYSNFMSFDQYDRYTQSDNRQQNLDSTNKKLLDRLTPLNYNNRSGPIIGEITGEPLNSGSVDQGMPSRYFLEHKNPIYEDRNREKEKYNPNLDYNLYHAKPSLDIEYIESAPQQTKYSRYNGQRKHYY